MKNPESFNQKIQSKDPLPNSHQVFRTNSETPYERKTFTGFGSQTRKEARPLIDQTGFGPRVGQSKSNNLEWLKARKRATLVLSHPEQMSVWGKPLCRNAPLGGGRLAYLTGIQGSCKTSGINWPKKEIQSLNRDQSTQIIFQRWEKHAMNCLQVATCSSPHWWKITLSYDICHLARGSPGVAKA